MHNPDQNLRQQALNNERKEKTAGIRLSQALSMVELHVPTAKIGLTLCGKRHKQGYVPQFKNKKHGKDLKEPLVSPSKLFGWHGFAEGLVVEVASFDGDADDVAFGVIVAQHGQRGVVFQCILDKPS